MNRLVLSVTIAAALGLAACGGQDQPAADAAGEEVVTGQPGELGTAEGSFDVAGETNSGADAAIEGNVQAGQ